MSARNRSVLWATSVNLSATSLDWTGWWNIEQFQVISAGPPLFWPIPHHWWNNRNQTDDIAAIWITTAFIHKNFYCDLNCDRNAWIFPLNQDLIKPLHQQPTFAISLVFVFSDTARKNRQEGKTNAIKVPIVAPVKAKTNSTITQKKYQNHHHPLSSPLLFQGNSRSKLVQTTSNGTSAESL